MADLLNRCEFGPFPGMQMDSMMDILWNIKDDSLILYGRWLLFIHARQQRLGNRAERCYAKYILERYESSHSER